MSKLNERLSKLADFKKRDDELKARAALIDIDAKMLGEEFRKYMCSEFGFPEEKQLHLSEILKSVLESSYDKKD